MAMTKTQKPLKISKMKSENILEFITEKISGRELANILNYGKSKMYDVRAELIELDKEGGSFYSLSKTFTVYELNKVIETYNSYIENPEQYTVKTKAEKRKESIEKQKKTVDVHMKDLNLDYDKNIVTERAEQKNESDQNIDSNDDE
ncbi:hypothetical protein BU107_04415 [Staphylococcus xylosus]|uniref:hypothetical protein n=1 Tax=Staphylococcus xylosus TaxID=1288 RepID=UPI000E68CE59|nr:hypothetical protein [Staphylococcus xylosus]RIM88972.1 hypothetical protein BU107_04415 [Staphylococcus xylosus]